MRHFDVSKTVCAHGDFSERVGTKSREQLFRCDSGGPKRAKRERVVALGETLAALVADEVTVIIVGRGKLKSALEQNLPRR